MPGGKGRKRIDLLGQRFGRLIAVQRVPVERGQSWWLCDCDCGVKDHRVPASALRGHKIRSCGCMRRMKFAKSRRRRWPNKTLHFPCAGFDDDIGEFLEG